MLTKLHYEQLKWQQRLKQHHNALLDALENPLSLNNVFNLTLQKTLRIFIKTYTAESHAAPSSASTFHNLAGIFFSIMENENLWPKVGECHSVKSCIFLFSLATDSDEPSGVSSSRRTTCTFGGVRSEAYVAASGSHELITEIGGDITAALRYTLAVAKRWMRKCFEKVLSPQLHTICFQTID